MPIQNARINVGKLLRKAHLFSACLVVVLTILSPISFLFYLLFFWTGMVLVNYIYGKCILTKIEMKLTRENVTIVDPCLSIVGCDLSNKNRKAITIFTGVSMFIITLIRSHYALD